MAGAAGCVQVEESREVPVAVSLGRKSGTPSLHTSAKPAGRDKDREEGLAREPSPCASLPGQAEARDPRGRRHLRKGGGC